MTVLSAVAIIVMVQKATLWLPTRPRLQGSINAKGC